MNAKQLMAVGATLACLAATGPAQGVVVERVVAVVGEKALLLSDLNKRAQPFMLKMHQQVPKGPQRAAAATKLRSQVLEQLVNEELEALAALRTHTDVSAEEVDRSLTHIARSRNLTMGQLFDAVREETGMGNLEYRQAVRREVLEGKMLNRFIQNQRVKEQEVAEMFDRLRKEERQVLLYDPAWIVLRLDSAPSAEQLAGRMKLAQQIVAQARAGEDFGALAAQHSEDPTTSSTGGSLGIRTPARSPNARSGKYKWLAKDLERRAFGLEPGTVSEPFRFKDAIVVLTVKSRQPSRYTSFEAARAELSHFVRIEKLQKVKAKWLKDLRRRTHVDVRL